MRTSTDRPSRRRTFRRSIMTSGSRAGASTFPAWLLGQNHSERKLQCRCKARDLNGRRRCRGTSCRACRRRLLEEDVKLLDQRPNAGLCTDGLIWQRPEFAARRRDHTSRTTEIASHSHEASLMARPDADMVRLPTHDNRHRSPVMICPSRGSPRLLSYRIIGSARGAIFLRCSKAKSLLPGIWGHD